MPHGVVLFIGVLAFVAFLGEGAMLDWSAVFLADVRHVDASLAGIGYVTFTLTMTVAPVRRRLVARVGRQRAIVFGALPPPAACWCWLRPGSVPGSATCWWAWAAPTSCGAVHWRATRPMPGALAITAVSARSCRHPRPGADRLRRQSLRPDRRVHRRGDGPLLLVAMSTRWLRV
jgi:hypothetical protein